MARRYRSAPSMWRMRRSRRRMRSPPSSPRRQDICPKKPLSPARIAAWHRCGAILHSASSPRLAKGQNSRANDLAKRPALGVLPSPVWGGVGGGGRSSRTGSRPPTPTPTPALRADPPHKGEGRRALLALRAVARADAARASPTRAGYILSHHYRQPLSFPRRVFCVRVLLCRFTHPDDGVGGVPRVVGCLRGTRWACT